MQTFQLHNSALKWCTCTRLEAQTQRNWLYEGMGGHHFLRIRHDNPLIKLYPCEQYRPDKCLLCGCTLRQHLASTGGRRNYSAALQEHYAAIGHKQAVTPLSTVYPAVYASTNSAINGGLRGLAAGLSRVIVQRCRVAGPEFDQLLQPVVAEQPKQPKTGR
jgi:hypothetical protein